MRIEKHAWKKKRVNGTNKPQQIRQTNKCIRRHTYQIPFSLEISTVGAVASRCLSPYNIAIGFVVCGPQPLFPSPIHFQCLFICLLVSSAHKKAMSEHSRIWIGATPFCHKIIYASMIKSGQQDCVSI